MSPRARTRKAPRPAIHAALEELRWRQVLVRASGIVYRGVLIGADDDDVYLKGELRYLVLPMERVTSIHLEESRDSLDAKKCVPAEFYREPHET
ncbi:MAG TPA: hypothetical protein PK668_14155 [Myxococcota bacterium]|nr:hypothetical protein [Myxococcota bacterium]HRY93995.1 hypothetical protein [Myxococcota bacterium]HSA23538.1 hypothetical protein [Myxococcota bacterium]